MTWDDLGDLGWTGSRGRGPRRRRRRSGGRGGARGGRAGAGTRTPRPRRGARTAATAPGRGTCAGARPPSAADDSQRQQLLLLPPPRPPLPAPPLLASPPPPCLASPRHRLAGSSPGSASATARRGASLSLVKFSRAASAVRCGAGEFTSGRSRVSVAGRRGRRTRTALLLLRTAGGVGWPV